MVFYLHRLAVVLAQMPYSPGDAAGVSPWKKPRGGPSRGPSRQQPLNNLPLDVRRKYPLPAWIINEPDETADRVERL